jgi:anaerobic selenocysteine-containing dehydrogenase
MANLPLIVKGVCPHDCPDTCSFDTQVVDGVAVELRGSHEHPVTQGFLCAKVNRYLERTYHPERLLSPMRRVGAKGEGRFEPATWEEAIADISAKLLDVVAAYGPESVVPYSYSGTLGQVQGGGSADRGSVHPLAEAYRRDAHDRRWPGRQSCARQLRPCHHQHHQHLRAQ